MDHPCQQFRLWIASEKAGVNDFFKGKLDRQKKDYTGFWQYRYCMSWHAPESIEGHLRNDKHKQAVLNYARAIQNSMGRNPYQHALNIPKDMQATLMTNIPMDENIDFWWHDIMGSFSISEKNGASRDGLLLVTLRANQMSLHHLQARGLMPPSLPTFLRHRL